MIHAHFHISTVGQCALILCLHHLHTPKDHEITLINYTTDFIRSS